MKISLHRSSSSHSIYGRVPSDQSLADLEKNAKLRDLHDSTRNESDTDSFAGEDTEDDFQELYGLSIDGEIQTYESTESAKKSSGSKRVMGSIHSGSTERRGRSADARIAEAEPEIAKVCNDCFGDLIFKEESSQRKKTFGLLRSRSAERRKFNEEVPKRSVSVRSKSTERKYSVERASKRGLGHRSKSAERRRAPERLLGLSALSFSRDSRKQNQELSELPRRSFGLNLKSYSLSESNVGTKEERENAKNESDTDSLAGESTEVDFQELYWLSNDAEIQVDQSSGSPKESSRSKRGTGFLRSRSAERRGRSTNARMAEAEAEIAKACNDSNGDFGFTEQSSLRIKSLGLLRSRSAERRKSNEEVPKRSLDLRSRSSESAEGGSKRVLGLRSRSAERRAPERSLRSRALSFSRDSRKGNKESSDLSEKPAELDPEWVSLLECNGRTKKENAKMNEHKHVETSRSIPDLKQEERQLQETEPMNMSDHGAVSQTFPKASSKRLIRSESREAERIESLASRGLLSKATSQRRMGPKSSSQGRVGSKSISKKKHIYPESRQTEKADPPTEHEGSVCNTSRENEFTSRRKVLSSKSSSKRSFHYSEPQESEAKDLSSEHWSVSESSSKKGQGSKSSGKKRQSSSDSSQEPEAKSEENKESDEVSEEAKERSCLPSRSSVDNYNYDRDSPSSSTHAPLSHRSRSVDNDNTYTAGSVSSGSCRHEPLSPRSQQRSLGIKRSISSRGLNTGRRENGSGASRAKAGGGGSGKSLEECVGMAQQLRQAAVVELSSAGDGDLQVMARSISSRELTDGRRKSGSGANRPKARGVSRGTSLDEGVSVAQQLRQAGIVERHLGADEELQEQEDQTAREFGRDCDFALEFPFVTVEREHGSGSKAFLQLDCIVIAAI